MTKGAIELLRRVNAAVQSALTRFQPERNHCAAVQARDLSTLRGEIHSATDCLRGLAAKAKRDAELEKQVSELRSNLEQLKQALPGLHGRLLAEYARLTAARTHCRAANAWVQASKKTL